MASMRKIERAESAAYQAYVAVTAELIATQAEVESSPNVTVADLARMSHLRRRAGAYRAQWETAMRRTEEATIAREVLA